MLYICVCIYILFSLDPYYCSWVSLLWLHIFKCTFKSTVIMSYLSQMCRVATFSQSWSNGIVLAKWHTQYQEAGKIQQILQVKGQLVPFGKQVQEGWPSLEALKRVQEGTSRPQGLDRLRLGGVSWLIDKMRKNPTGTCSFQARTQRSLVWGLCMGGQGLRHEGTQLWMKGSWLR